MNNVPWMWIAVLALFASLGLLILSRRSGDRLGAYIWLGLASLTMMGAAGVMAAVR
jgi:hypothetical protein